jgi:hypothetical protein
VFLEHAAMGIRFAVPVAQEVVGFRGQLWGQLLPPAFSVLEADIESFFDSIDRKTARF